MSHRQYLLLLIPLSLLNLNVSTASFALHTKVAFALYSHLPKYVEGSDVICDTNQQAPITDWYNEPACGSESDPCPAYFTFLEQEMCTACVFKVTLYMRDKLEPSNDVSSYKEGSQANPPKKVLYVKPSRSLKTGDLASKIYVPLTHDFVQGSETTLLTDIYDIPLFIDMRGAKTACPVPCYCARYNANPLRSNLGCVTTLVPECLMCIENNPDDLSPCQQLTGYTWTLDDTITDTSRCGAFPKNLKKIRFRRCPEQVNIMSRFAFDATIELNQECSFSTVQYQNFTMTDTPPEDSICGSYAWSIQEYQTLGSCGSTMESPCPIRVQIADPKICGRIFLMTIYFRACKNSDCFNYPVRLFVKIFSETVDEFHPFLRSTNPMVLYQLPFAGLNNVLTDVANGLCLQSPAAPSGKNLYYLHLSSGTACDDDSPQTYEFKAQNIASGSFAYYLFRNKRTKTNMYFNLDSNEEEFGGSSWHLDLNDAPNICPFSN